MKLADLAARIDAHLKRFEADPEINPRNERGLRPYFRAGAWASARWVYLCYVSYQGPSHVSASDAARYLAWLDAGNVGRHYKAFLHQETEDDRDR